MDILTWELALKALLIIVVSIVFYRNFLSPSTQHISLEEYNRRKIDKAKQGN